MTAFQKGILALFLLVTLLGLVGAVRHVLVLEPSTASSTSDAAVLAP